MAPAANPIAVVAILPSPDALEEFKIQTNSYSAEYGRSGGGVVNMLIRSGTNAYHGTLFEFLRNSKMDANDFFANRNGTALASFQRNQFGFTFGGPVVKNKVFYVEFSLHDRRPVRRPAVAGGVVTPPAAQGF